MAIQYLCLDTNIPLLDANHIISLGGDDTIICIAETVIDELDSKKSGLNELAYQARSFGRLIANAKPLGRTVEDNLVITKFEVEHTEVWIVSVKQYPDFSDVAHNILNDRKIIEVALQLEKFAYKPVTFISNDVMCRIRAESFGLNAIDFKVVDKVDYEFTKHLEVSEGTFRTLHNRNIKEVDPNHTIEHYNYKFTTPVSGQVKLASINNETINILGKDTEQELRRQEVNPSNADQLLLSRAIQDPTMDLIVCEALAGSGKTLVSLSNAMRLVKSKSPYNSILYIRASINDVEKIEEVGFLPGPQPLYSKVATPNGWKLMRDMVEGDTVITPTGTANVVSTQSYSDQPVYRLTMNDGSVVDAAASHLWETTVNKNTSVRTTLELLDHIEKYDHSIHYLPLIQPVQYSSKDFILDPYLIGYLLGDGILSGSHTRFACGGLDAEFIVPKLANLIDEFDCHITKSSDNNLMYTITDGIRGSTNELAAALTTVGLRGKKSFEKFIPDIYKFGSVSQRVSLLQGLIDTDGSIRDSGEVMFYTSSYQLATDVVEIAKSLGAYTTVSTRDRRGALKIKGIETNCNHIAYEVRIKRCEFILASIPRKANNFKYHEHSRLSIKSIESIGIDAVKCITLDSTDHLYLTDNYIPTHNSADEKNAVYFHPLYDSLDFIARNKFKGGKTKGKELDAKVEEYVDKLIEDCSITALTGLGLRGRTFSDTVVIIDEVQGMSKSSLQKVLTRFGKNCKIILVGSNNQIDNPNMTKFTNGLSVILNDCATATGGINKHVVPLQRVVRSDFAEYAEKLFSKES